jgi:nitrite reductase/ring-hydroxylating ferredoxin subunit
MKRKYLVGPIENFPPGSHPIIDVGGRSIGIYNVDGKIHAIANVCPHALAPICRGAVTGTYLPSGVGEYVFGMEGRVLRCIWHGWEFDVLTGESLFGIDRRRLAIFPAAVEDGQVVVTMRPRSGHQEDPDLE